MSDFFLLGSGPIPIETCYDCSEYNGPPILSTEGAEPANQQDLASALTIEPLPTSDWTSDHTWRFNGANEPDAVQQVDTSTYKRLTTGGADGTKPFSPPPTPNGQFNGHGLKDLTTGSKHSNRSVPSDDFSILPTHSSGLRAGPGRIPKHECFECHETCTTLHALELHAKQHHHRPFICVEPGCEKRYQRQDVLLRHAATHKAGTHICVECALVDKDRRFRRRDHLAAHLRSHRNSKVAALSPGIPTASSFARMSQMVQYGSGDICLSDCFAERFLQEGNSVDLSSSSDDGPVQLGRPASPGGIVQGVTEALSEVLGPDDIAIRAIVAPLETNIDPEGLAASLGKLVITRPEGLPEHVQEQLAFLVSA